MSLRICRLHAITTVAAFMLIAAAIAVPTTSLAATSVTSGDLKSQGYTCVRVSVNFWECTKSGAPTYWCTDNGQCQKAPTRSVYNTRIVAPPAPINSTNPPPKPVNPVVQATHTGLVGR
jgi:hypothetical protein